MNAQLAVNANSTRVNDTFVSSGRTVTDVSHKGRLITFVFDDGTSETFRAGAKLIVTRPQSPTTYQGK